MMETAVIVVLLLVSGYCIFSAVSAGQALHNEQIRVALLKDMLRKHGVRPEDMP